jgi:predicted kinase
MTSDDKCLGGHENSDGEWISCENPPVPGEEFCQPCIEDFEGRFRKAWGDIAQMEAPNASREDINRAIDGVIGPRILVLMVGIPGSGKTWLLERLMPTAHVIRPDDHIGYTKENPWTPKAAKAAWDRAHADLKQVLAAGGPDLIAFDATMVGAKKRAKYIRSAKKAGVRPVAVFADTPPELCQERNSAREPSRRVPDAAIKSMMGRLERPSIDEGFDIVAKFDGKNIRLEVNPDGECLHAMAKIATDFNTKPTSQGE